MLKNIFNKKKKGVVKSPILGVSRQLSSCSDSVFASESMGEGVLLIPEGKDIYAPFDGVVSAIFPTKHALGMVNSDGLELLIHMGIDSFALNGEGIDIFVHQDQHVTCGDVIARVNWEGFDANNIKRETPLIVTNASQWSLKIMQSQDSINQESVLIEYEEKR